MRVRRECADGGFTLLELLIALAIFAILSTLAYGTLHSALLARESSQIRTEQLQRLQMAFLFLGRDLEQVVERPVRDAYGDSRPAFYTPQRDYRLVFTRVGWNNPAYRQRSALQRVAYGLEGGRLLRYSWWALDRTDERPFRQQTLLDEVTTLELRFLDRQLRWHKEWPPLEKAEEEPLSPPPVAVEVVMELPEWGRIRRLFRLPRGNEADNGGHQPGEAVSQGASRLRYRVTAHDWRKGENPLRTAFSAMLSARLYGREAKSSRVGMRTS